MADTEFGVNSPQAVKRWSDSLMRETLGKMGIKAHIGKGPESCIQLIGDLDKNPGDNVVFDFLMQDRSPGVNGDSKLEDHETPLNFFQDGLFINQKRHGHSFKGMTQQRTLHDLRATGRYSLSNWWAWFIEGSAFAHLAGTAGDGPENVAQALRVVTGSTDFAGNTLAAPDTDHLVDGSGGTFDVALIDQAVARAESINPRMAPIMVDGQPHFVCYLTPASVWKLRGSSTLWSQIQREAASRGSDNPIFTGALGIYNNVILRKSEFVVSVGTVRHNILLGQGALALAFGNAWEKQSRVNGQGGAFFDWKEQERDYGNIKGIGTASILGMKVPVFNGKRVGSIVIKSTDANP